MIHKSYLSLWIVAMSVVAYMTSGCVDDGTLPGDLVTGRSSGSGFSSLEHMVTLDCHLRGQSKGQYGFQGPCLHAIVAFTGAESDILDIQTSLGNMGLGVWRSDYTVKWMARGPNGPVANSVTLLFDGRRRAITVFDQDYAMENGCIFVLEMDMYSGAGSVHQLTAGAACDACRLSPQVREALSNLECGF